MVMMTIVVISVKNDEDDNCDYNDSGVHGFNDETMVRMRVHGP